MQEKHALGQDNETGSTTEHCPKYRQSTVVAQMQLREGILR